jgi:hypothetical protein
MRIILVFSALLMLAGCVSKSEAQRQAREAYLAGQNQALTAAAAAAKNSTAPITIRGAVENDTIPWADDLTLAQALLAANYKPLGTPNRISIFRDGRTIPVNVRDFLQGNDIPLQPGDRIDLTH